MSRPLVDTEPIRNAILWARLFQIVMSVVYIGCTGHALAHKGWWTEILNNALFGIIVAACTIILLLPWLWACLRRHPIGLAYGHPFRVWSLWISAILRDFLIMAAWFAVLILMSLPKHKDFRNMFTTPPYAAWNAGIVCAAIEILASMYSLYLVIRLWMVAAPRIMRFEAI